ncbi:transcriptional regulator BetI [Celeribacter sp. HF31]|uniref:transcriptional regulator BetI n=1 Tax=Celeribacter sp. HF31 TaxID=2721558 RepID=UPI001430CF93|nr:transcriptional regulator BetI [Celeribacter sp. HF31]NIY79614.1 transcriptional regulator BetI [Celeribacter sp. HF31]
MGRRPLSTIRRKEFARAAYDCLARHGMSGTTLARVAETAGVSKASLLHYFKNKDELLEAAMRYGNGILKDENAALMKIARTPWQRIYAVIEANTSPRSFKPSVAHGWLTLLAAVPLNPQYCRIQKAIYARTKSNLIGPLRTLSDQETAVAVTETLVSIIDGVWLRLGLGIEPMSTENARAQIELALDARFGQSEERTHARDIMTEASRILMLSKGVNR